MISPICFQQKSVKELVNEMEMNLRKEILINNASTVLSATLIPNTKPIPNTNSLLNVNSRPNTEPAVSPDNSILTNTTYFTQNDYSDEITCYSPISVLNQPAGLNPKVSCLMLDEKSYYDSPTPKNRHILSTYRSWKYSGTSVNYVFGKDNDQDSSGKLDATTENQNATEDDFDDHDTTKIEAHECSLKLELRKSDWQSRTYRNNIRSTISGDKVEIMDHKVLDGHSSDKFSSRYSFRQHVSSTEFPSPSFCLNNQFGSSSGLSKVGIGVVDKTLETLSNETLSTNNAIIRRLNRRSRRKNDFKTPFWDHWNSAKDQSPVHINGSWDKRLKNQLKADDNSPSSQIIKTNRMNKSIICHSSENKSNNKCKSANNSPNSHFHPPVAEFCSSGASLETLFEQIMKNDNSTKNIYQLSEFDKQVVVNTYHNKYLADLGYTPDNMFKNEPERPGDAAGEEYESSEKEKKWGKMKIYEIKSPNSVPGGYSSNTKSTENNNKIDLICLGSKNNSTLLGSMQSSHKKMTLPLKSCIKKHQKPEQQTEYPKIKNFKQDSVNSTEVEEGSPDTIKKTVRFANDLDYETEAWNTFLPMAVKQDLSLIAETHEDKSKSESESDNENSGTARSLGLNESCTKYLGHYSSVFTTPETFPSYFLDSSPFTSSTEWSGPHHHQYFQTPNGIKLLCVYNEPATFLNTQEHLLVRILKAKPEVKKPKLANKESRRKNRMERDNKEKRKNRKRSLKSKQVQVVINACLTLLSAKLQTNFFSLTSANANTFTNLSFTDPSTEKIPK